MWLVDQKGDEIKCIYFYSNSNNPGEQLQEGKVFFLSGG